MFKDKIRYYRRLKGVSQRALAENLGYKSFTTIQKWEDGTASPSIYNAKRVAEILGVTIEQLVSDEDNWTTEELKEIEKFKAYLRSKIK